MPPVSLAPPCSPWCQFTSQEVPSINVGAWITSLTAVRTRECCWCCPTQHTHFLTAWTLSCGHSNEALWSMSHCFLYDCLWGCFHFIMSVTLSLTLGALYVCQYFIIMLFWPAVAQNVRRQEWGFQSLRTLFLAVSVCVRFTILRAFPSNEWCRPSLVVCTDTRWYLQVVFLINTMKLVSVTHCVHADMSVS